MPWAGLCKVKRLVCALMHSPASKFPLIFDAPNFSLLLLQPRRLSFGGFGTLRRKRQEDSEEYVCPLDVQMPQSSSFHRGLVVYEDELDQLEQVLKLFLSANHKPSS